MTGPERQSEPGGRLGLAAVGAGALMVACCGAPLIAVGAFGALSGGLLFGVGIGAAIAVAAIVAIVMRVRWKRRAACHDQECQR